MSSIERRRSDRRDVGGPDFRAVLEQGPGLHLILDPDLTIVGASSAYCAATMTVREDILHRPLFEVFPDNPQDAAASGEDNLRASLRRVLEDRVPDTMAVQKYDIRRPESEGGGFEVRYWSPINTPVFDQQGELQCIVHRVEDVTEFVILKRSAAQPSRSTIELTERTEKMEAEILERSRELHEANRQLKSASLAKGQFLSRMSHELRTPLTAILGFGELLTLNDLDKESRGWVDTILRASGHLLNLVNDVLDLAKIEEGAPSMSTERLHIATVVGEAIELVSSTAAREDVRLHAALGDAGRLAVLADHQRVKQVLINLLTNAVKYNRRGGEVSVTVDPVGGDDMIEIGIADTGPGISPRDLPRLFVPFERLQAGSTSVEGTGLGLALSRTLVEAMGGTIGVTSVVGEGSTFWVRLPAARSGDEHEQAPGRDSVVAARHYPSVKRLLYIEDTAANVQFVEGVLRRRPSVTVTSTQLGETGLALAREEPPDLILLDLHLPDMGGDKVLRELQAASATRHVPVVILTADATNRHLDRLVRAGASGYLTKPISLRDLLGVVDEHLAPDAGHSSASTPHASASTQD